jgi:hypothetical protein
MRSEWDANRCQRNMLKDKGQRTNENESKDEKEHQAT